MIGYIFSDNNLSINLFIYSLFLKTTRKAQFPNQKKLQKRKKNIKEKKKNKAKAKESGKAPHSNSSLSLNLSFSYHSLMALYLPSLSILLLLFFRSSTAFWCVARFDVTSQALQAALDYACAAGADCAPIQPNGLCFLPNTLPAHASYAFNSYFQRRGMAPGSCNFAGTSTIAKTDPSMYFTKPKLNRIG